MGVLRFEQAGRILKESAVLYGVVPLNDRSADSVCPLSRHGVVEGEGGKERIRFWVRLRGGIGGSFDVE